MFPRRNKENVRIIRLRKWIQPVHLFQSFVIKEKKSAIFVNFPIFVFCNNLNRPINCKPHKKTNTAGFRSPNNVFFAIVSKATLRQIISSRDIKKM